MRFAKGFPLFCNLPAGFTKLSKTLFHIVAFSRAQESNIKITRWEAGYDFMRTVNSLFENEKHSTAPLRWNRISTLAGGFVWTALLLLPPFGAIHGIVEKLFLLAPLVIVPLGLSHVAPSGSKGWSTALHRVLIFIQPIGAIMAVVSFFIPSGTLAASFAAGWFFVSGMTALLGLTRFLERKRHRAEELCTDSGLVYLAVGGTWLVIARFGLEPLGFGDVIVLLTAVHFHYAGFAALILAGLGGRRLRPSTVGVRRIYQIIVAGLISGPALVAVGIVLSPIIGLIGALVLAISFTLLAVLVVGWIIPDLPSKVTQIMLLISAVSSTVGIALACLYAYSVTAKTLILTIPQMAMIHGVVNAIGFCLAGLIAWSLILRQNE